MKSPGDVPGSFFLSELILAGVSRIRGRGSLRERNAGYRALSSSIPHIRVDSRAGLHPARRSAALRGSLDPLASPGRRFEGVGEVLCLVHDLTVAELHDAYGVRRSPLVGDGVFGDPEITFSDNSPDVET